MYSCYILYLFQILQIDIHINITTVQLEQNLKYLWPYFFYKFTLLNTYSENNI